jgi:hypothetical protein
MYYFLQVAVLIRDFHIELATTLSVLYAELCVGIVCLSLFEASHSAGELHERLQTALLLARRFNNLFRTRDELTCLFSLENQRQP